MHYKILQSHISMQQIVILPVCNMGVSAHGTITGSQGCQILLLLLLSLFITLLKTSQFENGTHFYGWTESECFS